MIEVKNISKYFTDDFGYRNFIFRNISFNVEDNLITSIVAPAGSGKSTLGKIICGLDSPSDGEVINQAEKKIIFIPSNPSSFPWLSVSQNIKIGCTNLEGTELFNLINLVGLEGYENYFPDNLSYGFRFRIALARALANNPQAIILDEPFNFLDSKTKMEILFLIRKINKVRRIPFLLTTTNITEAVFLSDIIYLMKKNPGEIISQIKINLPKPRTKSTFELRSYVRYRDLIENTFKKIESQKMFNLSI